MVSELIRTLKPITGVSTPFRTTAKTAYRPVADRSAFGSAVTAAAQPETISSLLRRSFPMGSGFFSR